MMKRLMQRAGLLVLGIGLIGLVGCASKGTVSGKVSFNGKPVVTGSVTALASDGVPYVAMIGSDGSYSIPGVPSGTVKFLVASPNPDAGQRAGPRAAGGEGDLAASAPAPAASTVPKGAWMQLPAKYSDPQKTDLTGTVKGDSVINLELKP